MDKPIPIRLPKSFTIDRSEWVTGRNLDERKNPSQLLNFNKKKCCVGFACLAAGLSEEEIDGVEAPMGTWKVKGLSGFDKLGNWKHEGIAPEIYLVNDDSGLTDQEREEDVRDLFAKIGVEVKFVGEYSV